MLICENLENTNSTCLVECLAWWGSARAATSSRGPSMASALPSLSLCVHFPYGPGWCAGCACLGPALWPPGPHSPASLPWICAACWLIGEASLAHLSETYFFPALLFSRNTSLCYLFVLPIHLLNCPFLMLKCQLPAVGDSSLLLSLPNPRLRQCRHTIGAQKYSLNESAKANALHAAVQGTGH